MSLIRSRKGWLPVGHSRVCVYMGIYDVLRELIGSGLEDESFEDEIHLVSTKYLLQNYLRPQEVFSCMFGTLIRFIDILA